MESDVGRAQVAMGDSLFMAVFQGPQDLVDDPGDDIFSKDVLRHHLQAFEQRVLGKRVGDDDDVLAGQKGVANAHNVRVLQLLQDRHFSTQVAKVNC